MIPVRTNEDKNAAGVNLSINIVSITPKKRKAKTDAERQKSLYTKKTAEGWKKVWMPPELLQHIACLGSVDAVLTEQSKTKADLKALKEKFCSQEAELETAKQKLKQLDVENSSLRKRGLWARLWNKGL